MSEGMIGLLPLGEVRGVVGDLMEKLVGSEGPAFADELKKFVVKKPCWVKKTDSGIVTPDSALLAPAEVAEFGIPTLCRRRSNPLAIREEDPKSPFGFSDMCGFAFPDLKRVRAVTGKPYRLVKPTTFGEMVAAVGGEAVVRKHHLFTTRQIRWLVDKQAKGEPGPLHNNGWANFFFVLTTGGPLAVVGVLWDSACGCWRVWAPPVSDPNRRDDGRRLFLRAA